MNLCVRCQQLLRGTNGATHPEHTSQCALCLGILEDSFLKDMLKQISALLASERYDATSFRVSVATPHNLAVRCHLMQLSYDGLPVADQLRLSSFSVHQFVREYLREELAGIVHLAHDVHSPFEIAVKLTHPRSEIECSQFCGPMLAKEQLAKSGRKRRRQPADLKVTWKHIEQAKLLYSKQDLVDRRSGYIDLSLHTEGCDVTITTEMEPVYVAGRYLKYSRSLPQTPWILNGVRRGNSSVEELIAGPVIEALRASGYNFMSSGREDVDVRMLGGGRPFCLEVRNPRQLSLSESACKHIESTVGLGVELTDTFCEQSTKASCNFCEKADVLENARIISVVGVTLVDKRSVDQLKLSAEGRSKQYEALIVCREAIADETLDKLNGVVNLTIQQKTPVRVLHRRTLLTRPRCIYSMKVTRLADPLHYTLRLQTQAGTYIKEFVHSDFGRTVPSLGDLAGNQCDLLTLDVVDVDEEWPPV